MGRVNHPPLPSLGVKKEAKRIAGLAERLYLSVDRECCRPQAGTQLLKLDTASINKIEKQMAMTLTFQKPKQRSR